MQPIIALPAEALLHLTEQEGGPFCILRAAITAIRQRPEDARTVIYFGTSTHFPWEVSHDSTSG